MFFLIQGGVKLFLLVFSTCFSSLFLGWFCFFFSKELGPIWTLRDRQTNTRACLHGSRSQIDFQKIGTLDNVHTLFSTLETPHLEKKSANFTSQLRTLAYSARTNCRAPGESSRFAFLDINTKHSCSDDLLHATPLTPEQSCTRHLCHVEPAHEPNTNRRSCIITNAATCCANCLTTIVLDNCGAQNTSQTPIANDAGRTQKRVTMPNGLLALFCVPSQTETPFPPPSLPLPLHAHRQ